MSQQAFARLVQRAVTEAKDRRGWTPARLVRASGITAATLRAWLTGVGPMPGLDDVRRFCTAVEIPVGPALAALGLKEVERVDAAPRPDTDVAIRRLRIIR
jgi:transcriptional regulator with XRE-family HTH domain